MIYAISDVHGDLNQAKLKLKEAGVINYLGNWSVANSVLVVNGDSVDRGPSSVETLKYWMYLDGISTSFNNKIYHTLGNHDALFIAACKVEENNAFYKLIFENFIRNGGRINEVKEVKNNIQLLDWMERMPLMVKVNQYLFQHADQIDVYGARKIPIAGAFTSLVSKINKTKKPLSPRDYYKVFWDMTEIRFWGQKGDMTKEELSEIEEDIDDYLHFLGAKVIVHGHTPSGANGPLWYRNGTICNIDAMLSSGYKSDYNRGCVLTIKEAIRSIEV